MLTLGIETSCDETAASVCQDGQNVLSNIISSQMDLHAPFAGVVPELACRSHLSNISDVVSRSLEESDCQSRHIDLISVTRGPGLIGALLIGTSFAGAFAQMLGKPVVGVNHLEAHLCSGRLDHPNIEFPFIGLIVSGGHTMLILAKQLGEYQILGQTVDDAAGEAFDKVASILSLPYPGGPSIQNEALKGNVSAFDFPRPMLHSKNLNFSFSGLKTAVLYRVQSMDKNNLPIADLAASFQKSVIDVLVEKTIQATEETQIKKIVIGGGVTANQLLRDRLTEKCQTEQIDLYLPTKAMCTDNAAMIASLGYYRYQSGLEKNPSLVAVDRWVF